MIAQGGFAQKSKKAKALIFIGKLLMAICIITFFVALIYVGIIKSEWLIALVLIISSIVLFILSVGLVAYAMIILPIREMAKQTEKMMQQFGDVDMSNFDQIFNDPNMQKMLGDIALDNEVKEADYEEVE